MTEDNKSWQSTDEGGGRDDGPRDPEGPNGKPPDSEADESAERCAGKSLEEKLKEIMAAIDKAKAELDRAQQETGEFERQKKEVEKLQGELTKLLESYEKAREGLLEDSGKLKRFKRKTTECFASRKEVLEHKVAKARKAVDREIDKLCAEAEAARQSADEARETHETCLGKVEKLEKKLERRKALEQRIKDLLADLKTRRQKINDAEQGCKSALAYYWFQEFCVAFDGRPKVVKTERLKRLIEDVACELWKVREKCVKAELDLKAKEKVAEETGTACKDAEDQREQEIEKRLGKSEAEEAD